ncbi:hypothetical protein ACWKW6_12295 [Dyadobacter jiangsuensis]
MLSKEFQRIQRHMDALNHRTDLLSDGFIQYFFEPISLTVNFRSPEAGFLRLISYFYVITHEDDSKLNLKFWGDKSQVYFSSETVISHFTNLINAGRTVLQHNVSQESPSDRLKIYMWEDWLQNCVGKTKKFNSTDWRVCSMELLSEFSLVLREVEKSLSHITELPEDIREVVISDWITKVKNSYPIYRYLNLARDVSVAFSYPELSVSKFCQRHYKRWLSELGELEDFDFESFARRQIEATLLDDAAQKRLPLPIDGIDVMEYFDIEGGVEVRRLLLAAQARYQASPSSKEDLLSYLKDFQGKTENPDSQNPELL